MDGWYGMVWYGMVWYGMVWYGMVWYGIVWYGMVWYGIVWYGMVWYGMVLYVCMPACVRACIHVCMYVRTYVCMYVCICMYMCVYNIYIYIYIYIHTYTHIYTHTYMTSNPEGAGGPQGAQGGGVQGRRSHASADTGSIPQLRFIQIHQLFRIQYTWFELEAVIIDWCIRINVCLVSMRFGRRPGGYGKVTYQSEQRYNIWWWRAIPSLFILYEG